jgi:hypothetical protein
MTSFDINDNNSNIPLNYLATNKGHNMPWISSGPIIMAIIRRDSYEINPSKVCTTPGIILDTINSTKTIGNSPKVMWSNFHYCNRNLLEYSNVESTQIAKISMYFPNPRSEGILLLP